CIVCRAKFRWNHSGILGVGLLIFCVCSTARETSRGRVEVGRVGGGVEPEIEAAATDGPGGGSTGFAAGAGSGAGGGVAGAFASAFSVSLAAGRTGSDFLLDLEAAACAGFACSFLAEPAGVWAGGLVSAACCTGALCSGAR